MRTIENAIEQVRESVTRARAEVKTQDEARKRRCEEIEAMLREPLEAIKNGLEPVGVKANVVPRASLDDIGPGLDTAIEIRFTHPLPHFEKLQARISVSGARDGKRVFVHFTHGYTQGKPEKLVYEVAGSVASDDLTSVEGLVAEALCLIVSS
ncbi:hypothetical protein WME95_15850 [Sorangium sp. So ce327]|uniref:hypothetical protein n=1 Tax=Sorangium sp. So ce327 TaxID=3133301 RepID=UPI003F6002D2